MNIKNIIAALLLGAGALAVSACSASSMDSASRPSISVCARRRSRSRLARMSASDRPANWALR